MYWLQELSISDTKLNLKLENIPMVHSLNLNYMNFSGVTFIFALTHFTSLRIMNCGFIFTKQYASLQDLRVPPFWSGNDMHLITITKFKDFPQYFLAGTQIYGEFDFDEITTIQEMSFAGTNLELRNFAIRPDFKVVDCEGLYINY